MLNSFKHEWWVCHCYIILCTFLYFKKFPKWDKKATLEENCQCSSFSVSHTLTHTHTHIHTHTSTPTPIHRHTHTETHTHTQTQAHSHTFTHTHTHIYKHIHTHTETHTYTYRHSHTHTRTHRHTCPLADTRPPFVSCEIRSGSLNLSRPQLPLGGKDTSLPWKPRVAPDGLLGCSSFQRCGVSFACLSGDRSHQAPREAGTVSGFFTCNLPPASQSCHGAPGPRRPPDPPEASLWRSRRLGAERGVRGRPDGGKTQPQGGWAPGRGRGGQRSPGPQVRSPLRKQAGPAGENSFLGWHASQHGCEHGRNKKVCDHAHLSGRNRSRAQRLGNEPPRSRHLHAWSSRCNGATLSPGKPKPDTQPPASLFLYFAPSSRFSSGVQNRYLWCLSQGLIPAAWICSCKPVNSSGYLFLSAA